MKKAKQLAERLGLGALALAMALGLAACKKKNPTPSDKTDSETKEETTAGGDGNLTPSYSGNTYNYERFRILMREDAVYVNSMAVEEENGSELDKKVYYRNRAVEDQLKVILKFDTKSMDQVHQTVNKMAQNGSNTYGLVINHGRQIFHEITTDKYLDWNTLPSVNLNASWWSQNIQKDWTTPSGALYAANGDISYLSVGRANCMFFNKDLLAPLPDADPYQYVEQDEWTFDNFFKLVTDVGATLQADGGYGYQCQYSRGPVDALLATGYSMVEISKDGDKVSAKVGVDNERAIKAVDQFTAFLKAGNAKEEANLEAAQKAFAGGKIAFFDDNVEYATSKYSNLNFGILPFPKFDSEVENYRALLGSGTDTFAIPAAVTDEYRTCIGDVVECLAYNGYLSVMPFYYETLLQGQAVKDEQSLKSLQIIHDSLVFDLGEYLNPAGVGDLAKNVASGEYSSFSNALEQFRLSGKFETEMAIWLAK